MSGASDFRIYASRVEKPRTSPELLVRAARLYTGEDSAEFEILREKHGKPYFKGCPELHFSLTHSGEYWLCAFGAAPVGLDLQEHRAGNLEGISRRFFHPEEDEFLKAGGYEGFFAVWAAKESVVKFTGRGLSEELREFSAVKGGEITGEALGLRLRFIEFHPGYSLCICAKEIGDVSIEEI